MDICDDGSEKSLQNSSEKAFPIWEYKTRDQLNEMTKLEVINYWKKLLSIVTDQSEELVHLLQERELLLDGVDVRNVFIEQLLKLQCKTIEPSFNKTFANESAEDEFNSEWDEIS